MRVLAKARKKRELVELLSAESGKCLLKLRRRLVKNFLDLLILMELRNTHLSGYDVMTWSTEDSEFCWVQAASTLSYTGWREKA